MNIKVRRSVAKGGDTGSDFPDLFARMRPRVPGMRSDFVHLDRAMREGLSV
jgi:hypothetical protein